MYHEQLLQIFDRVSRTGKTASPFEQVLVYALASLDSPNDPDFAEMFNDPEMAEIRKLVGWAMQPSKSNEDGSVAVMSYHKSLVAEAAGDRGGSIAASRILLRHLNKAEYPETWANSHLKIGTAMAVLSGGSKE